MNLILATVSNIENCDNLHIVKFDFQGATLSMMSLDINPNIKIGTKVKLITKSTNIVLAKDLTGNISFSNELKCTIKNIENGKLLSSIKLQIFDTLLESIITVDSSNKMDLKVGDEVTAFIQQSELSILEVLDN